MSGYPLASGQTKAIVSVVCPVCRARREMNPQEVHAEVLRTGDGPRLCHLAWQLGLAPEGTKPWSDTPESMLYDRDAREPWEPHVSLSQAHTVLHRLRAQGWATTVSTVPPLGGVSGCVEATKAGQTVRVYWGGGAFVDHEEAVAVLRASVLAVTLESTP